jgi:cytoskeletal protein RodZ
MIKSNKTLEELLSEARNEFHISLEEASKDLNIPFRYLESLEKGKLDDLPGNEYVKKTLKKYCGYLGINFKTCWNKAKKKSSFIGIRKINVEKRYLASWPQLVRRGVVLFVVLAVLIFLSIKVQQIFIPPVLSISYPQDGSVVVSKQIVVSGKSEPEVELIVNNRKIFVDSEGNFETTIDLQTGLNLIKISAKKRYSRVKESDIRLLYKSN